VKVAEVPVAGRKLLKVLVPAAVILIAVVIAGAFYLRSRSTKHATKLTEKNTIVLADFANRQARVRELWTCARVRHRGVWRSSGKGAGTGQAGCGLGHSGGQQRRWSDLAGECRYRTSRLWQSCGSAAVSGRGFEVGSYESGRRGRSRACICHGG
jgi:hypothetical protein